MRGTGGTGLDKWRPMGGGGGGSSMQAVLFHYFV